MGNHEYCSDCGEDDFHFGTPCNPAKKAEQDAWKKKNSDREAEEIERLKELRQELISRGFYAELNYKGYAILEVRA